MPAKVFCNVSKGLVQIVTQHLNSVDGGIYAVDIRHISPIDAREQAAMLLKAAAMADAQTPDESDAAYMLAANQVGYPASESPIGVQAELFG